MERKGKFLFYLSFVQIEKRRKNYLGSQFSILGIEKSFYPDLGVQVCFEYSNCNQGLLEHLLKIKRPLEWNPLERDRKSQKYTCLKKTGTNLPPSIWPHESHCGIQKENRIRLHRTKNIELPPKKIEGEKMSEEVTSYWTERYGLNQSNTSWTRDRSIPVGNRKSQIHSIHWGQRSLQKVVWQSLAYLHGQGTYLLSYLEIPAPNNRLKQESKIPEFRRAGYEQYCWRFDAIFTPLIVHCIRVYHWMFS